MTARGIYTFQQCEGNLILDSQHAKLVLILYTLHEREDKRFSKD